MLFKKEHSDLLEKSINKFFLIYSGAESCPLCNMYYSNYCVGCPINSILDIGGCPLVYYKSINNTTEWIILLKNILKKTILFRDLTL